MFYKPLLCALSLGLVPFALAQAGWSVHHDPSGFEVGYPMGWTAEGAKDGHVIIQSSDGSVFAVLQPFSLEQGRAQETIGPLIQHMTSIFPNAQIGQTQQVGVEPDEAVAKVTFEDHGDPAQANVLCVLYQGHGMLYALGAPNRVFASKKLVLIKVLQSFKYGSDAPAPKASGVEKTGDSLAFKNWTDPNEGMFTTEVPSGWHAYGGAYRFAPIDVRTQISLVSPGGQIMLQYGDAKLTTLVVPGPSSLTRGLGEGGQYEVNGVTYTVISYLTGEQFSGQFVQLKLKKDHPDLQVTGSKERTDLEQKVNAQMNGETANIGETDFTYTDHGTSREGACMAATIQIPQSGGAWQAIPSYITAPVGKMDAGWKAWDRVIAAMKIRPDWSAKQSQITANFNEMVLHNHEAAMQQLHEDYVKAMRRLDDSFRGWDNVVNNTTDVRDPGTGAAYSVAAGSNFYWRSPTGGVVGSSSGSSPNVSLTPLEKF